MRTVRRRTMRQRIMHAYRVSEAQKETVQQAFEDFSAVWRETMGDQFQEKVELRRKMRERSREILLKYKQEQGEPTGWKLPRPHEDPVMATMKDREREIEREHPFDWYAVLDRVDEVLPKEQARRGRDRLAELYPNGLSEDEGDNRRIINRQTDAGESHPAPDRWDAYFKKFTARYDLTGAQANAANSILREIRARAAHLRRTKQDEIALHPAVADSEKRIRIAEAFQFDFEELFSQFTERLDALLTTSQHDK